MESSSPSILSDGYTRKENCMTTTARGAVREQATEEQGGAEQDIYPLLLATLIGRRQEHREEITPLLLAALMGRRQEGEERGGMIAPLLMADMGRGGGGQRDEMTAVVIAFIANRGEERREE